MPTTAVRTPGCGRWCEGATATAALLDLMESDHARIATAADVAAEVAPEGHHIADRHDRPTVHGKEDQLSAEREMNCPPTNER